MFAGMASRGAVLAVLAFLFAIVPASGIIVEKELSIVVDGATVEVIDTFGFLAGGHADWDIHSKPLSISGLGPHALVLGCKEKDLHHVQLTAMNSCQTSFQNSTALEKCYMFEVPHQERTQMRVDITSRGWISWGILMCGQGATVLQMEYTLVNPGGEHLGLGYIPLPTTYRTFAAFWSFLFVVQTYYNLGMHQRSMTALHRLFLGLPIVKILHEVVGMFRWQVVSSYGYLPGWLELMSTSTISLNEAATYFVMVLIAKGWLVTRRVLPVNEAQSCMTVALLLLVLNMAYRYYKLNNFTFFSLAITYMVALAIILSSTARNIRELKMQIMILRQADIDPTNTPAHTKEAMYRSFQLYLFTFVCTRVFLEMVMLFLHEHPWIGHMFAELLDLLLCVTVGWIFRLRENSPFNTHRGEFSWLPMDPMDLMPRDGDTMQLVARMAELGVQIEVPPARIYETVIQKASEPGFTTSSWRYDNSACSSILLGEGPVVVVENPPVYVKGELVESVSLARPAQHSEQREFEVASVPESNRMEILVVQSPGEGDMQLPGTPEQRTGLPTT